MDLISNEILQEYQKKGFELEVISHLKSGKEAEVFLVVDKNKNQDYAFKVYKDNQNFSYKLYNPYLENVRINPKFKKMVKTKTFRGKKYMSNLRSLREFKVMERNQHDQSDKMAMVPLPIAMVENTLLIEFIGKDRRAAPRLQDYVMKDKDYPVFFEKILNLVWKMHENKVIHADLSPFNILVQDQNLYVIDFPQTIEIGVNPEWKAFLKRDLKNVTDFFKKEVDFKNYELYQKLLDSVA